nr:MAG TPA: RNA (guanine-9-)-methyltransferase domain-containing protein [Caudoviricetes sp.]
MSKQLVEYRELLTLKCVYLIGGIVRMSDSMGQ